MSAALQLDDLLTGLPLAASGTAAAESTEALGLMLERLPRKPYCTDDLSAGTRVLPRRIALRRRYIQLDPPGRIAALVFDVDRPGAALAWDDVGLPPPSWSAQSPDSGRAHLGYVLSWPVYRQPATAPGRYADAVYAAYKGRLGADPGYARLLAKNPFSPSWRTTCWRDEPYSLSELAEYVDLSSAPAPQRGDEAVQGGRNVALFEALRAWAYTAVPLYWRPGGETAWHDAVLDAAQRLSPEVCAGNSRGLLSWSEIRAVARSVARWTWRHMPPTGRRALIERTHGSDVQSKRGTQKGAKHRVELMPRAQEMRAGGASVREISAALGLGKSTVQDWLQR